MQDFDQASLNLRPCTILDKKFVYQTKKITMKPYVKEIWGNWDEKFQVERFNQNFDISLTQIVQYSGKDIGILVIEEVCDSIQVNNIQILPEYQNRGIGSYLLTAIITKAKKSGKAVTLQVLQTNPKAKKLYQRLGFKLIGYSEYHFQMKKP